MVYSNSDPFSNAGPLIAQERKKRGQSRAKFLADYKNKYGESIHQQALFNYETRQRKVDPTFARNALELLGVDVTGETIGRLGRPLRFTRAPYPDYAILGVAGMSDLHTMQILVLDGIAEMECEPVDCEYDNSLQLISKGGDNGGADIGLFNEPGWREQGEEYSNSIINLGEFVRFQGFAVLAGCSVEVRKKISVFSQILMQTADPRKPQYVLQALAQTFAQMPAETDILVPENTTMQMLLSKILKIAAERSDEGKEKIQKFLDKTKNSNLGEIEAFKKAREYCKRNKESEPFIYLGGLSQRIALEYSGAFELLGNDDLERVASTHSTQRTGRLELFSLLHPRILLLANKASIKKGFVDFNDYLVRLNTITQWLQDENSNLKFLNSMVLEQIQESYRNKDNISDNEAFLNEAFVNSPCPLMEIIVLENLERFQRVETNLLP